MFFYSAKLGGCRIILIKPTTLMNCQRQRGSDWLAIFIRLPSATYWSFTMNLDINFGEIRTCLGGSSAGHNGVNQLSTAWMTKVLAVSESVSGRRLHSTIDSADFVLGKFPKAEAEHLPKITKEVSSILNEYIFSEQPSGLKHENF